MAKKQFYCIDFRNMHNGLHGLFVFDKRQKAEDNYTYLKRGIRELEILRTKEKVSEEEGSLKYNMLIEDVCRESVDFYDEIDYRDKQEAMIRNRLEHYYEKNGFRYIVVNFMQTLDLYI